MSEIHALRDMAGDFPINAIAECLDRSESSVKAQARKCGISLTCDKDGLHWCNECMTWRTVEKCPVCRWNHLTRVYDSMTESFGVEMTSHPITYHSHDEMGYEDAERADERDARARYSASYKQWERVRKQFMVTAYLVRDEIETGTADVG